MLDTRQHARELIDRMAPGQISVVVGLLEMVLDPLAYALAKAPFDDEPVEASGWSGGSGDVPHDAVLADFGLTREDFDRMGRTPLEAGQAGR